MKTILVIDDDKSINELVKINLELAGYKVLSAFDGAVGYALCCQELPALVVLDVMMPEIDGYTVAKRIRENAKTKNIPILMLTAMGMIDDKAKGFDIGVDDYLVKPFEVQELVMRIRSLLKRYNEIPKSAATKDILTIGNITLIPDSYSIKINEKITKVTPIEFDILNLLVQNHGQMVSSARILKDIWGYEPNEDVDTIRVHVRHLRTKIDKIADGKKYIETVYKGGYILRPEGIR